MESKSEVSLSQSSITKHVTLANSIIVSVFKESVCIFYQFNSVEHFHLYLNDKIYDNFLTNDDIIDCISTYHLLFKTMKRFQIANNMPSFGSVFDDEQQNVLLNSIFPDSTAEDIKIQWMYYIINLILYSQIHNDDRYNSEGYKIKRGPSFT